MLKKPLLQRPHAAALPARAEHPADRRFETLMSMPGTSRRATPYRSSAMTRWPGAQLGPDALGPGAVLGQGPQSIGDDELDPAQAASRRIQSFLTAAAINLKRLAAALLGLLHLMRQCRRYHLSRCRRQKRTIFSC